MVDVIIPNDWWGEEDEAVLAEWLFNEGDKVFAGTNIALVMAGKAQFDLDAPCDGVLAIEIKLGEVVNQGSVICRII